MNLLPYHNPESVDESRVPDGWRFLYADEAGKWQCPPCRMWYPRVERFNMEVSALGCDWSITYIVPVNS